MREPAIVFTEYRDTLSRLQERIVAAGQQPAVLHGGLTPTDRSRVQQTFNEHGGTLLATDAASEGLNLHHRCRVVIHYELPWNPARLEQRAGRVDRLGQTRRVHEVALVAAHTAERLVIAPLFARLAGRTGATPSRMLDALTESRVAAAVMTGTEQAAADVGELDAIPSCAVVAPTDHAAHAVREAARLEHYRVLAARSCRGHAPETGVRTVVSTVDGPTRVPRGVHLVFVLALVDTDGSRLHAEPCLVRVDLQPQLVELLLHQSGRSGTRALGEAVAALAGPNHPIVRSFLHQHILDRLEGVAAREEHRRERQRRREKAIKEAIAPGEASAARLLVQAGLFDRRALRAAALRASSATARQDDLHERAAGLADGPPPASQIDFIAALFVPAR
jgi:hypothetical protein